MPSALFRFYAELNDLLPLDRRFRTFAHPCDGQSTVKDMIESLGVPHTEVDLILVNGESVDFSGRVQHGDRVSVYPVFESIDISPVARVRPEPLRQTRFILDTHLGRLAAYLRALGFDTHYRSHSPDEELARISRDEHRILLTRDVGLLKRSAVTHGHLMRETRPRLQLCEVVERFDLRRSVALFTRCLCCNTPLCSIDKESIAARLPERTHKLYAEFLTCQSCGRIYWQGSHYERMQRMIATVVDSVIP
ncbi:MAG TPA: Mut7-C RNAse domain-containing protein [Bryobacteraceae bacterium]|nr:Mut7-C RNAse domain-containing protein [Bryobacteraceae bacterium]